MHVQHAINTHHESVCHVALCCLCLHWDLCSTGFCDTLHMHICDFTMDQKASIKLCVRIRKSATETLEMLQQTYRRSNEPLRCFEWHPCAKRGRMLSSRQSHWSANATQNTSLGLCWQHSHLTVHDYVNPDRLVHLIEICSVLLISVAAAVKGKFT